MEQRVKHRPLIPRRISERGAHWRSATMLGLMALSSLAALLFIYIFMPGLWLSIMSIDESLDSHESGLALVASRMRFSFLFHTPASAI